MKQLLKKHKEKKKELTQSIHLINEKDYEFADVDTIVINVTNFDKDGNELKQFISSDAIFDTLLPSKGSEYFTNWAETSLNELSKKPGEVFTIKDEILPFDLILAYNQPSHLINENIVNEEWFTKLQKHRIEFFKESMKNMIANSIHQMILNRQSSIVFFISKKQNKIISYEEEIGIYYSVLTRDDVVKQIKNKDIYLVLVDDELFKVNDEETENNLEDKIEDQREIKFIEDEEIWNTPIVKEEEIEIIEDELSNQSNTLLIEEPKELIEGEFLDDMHNDQVESDEQL